MENSHALSPEVSICIFARNEAAVIVRVLRSLFAQTFLMEAARRGTRIEVLCVVNGSSDTTAELAEAEFARLRTDHPARGNFAARVAALETPGKINAWNEFVHRLAHPEARALVMMDADIVIHREGTLRSMYETLLAHPDSGIVVDRPCKEIEFKSRKSWRDRLSLAAGRATTSGQGQLCGQLYCIRASVARNIFLPRDLAACEDGFLKWIVCTDFLSTPARAEKIRVAPDAEHTFEAYTSVGDIFKNQQRQVIGQTIVHVLIDQHLKALPAASRRNLAGTLQTAEIEDPDWLRRRISEHVKNVRFSWQLYPGLATQRFKVLRELPIKSRITGLPAAVAGSLMTLAASIPAFRKLKSGCIQYWPQVQRGPVNLSPVLQVTQKTS